MKMQRQVEEIAVDVLEDQRERVLAAVALARLADGAGRRVGPERLVVGAAVVVAGEAEAARRPEDQQRRRKRQRAGPPAGCGPNQL